MADDVVLLVVGVAAIALLIIPAIVLEYLASKYKEPTGYTTGKQVRKIRRNMERKKR